MKIKELDGVDFALLMGFASMNYNKRNDAEEINLFKKKLRTENGIAVMNELLKPYSSGGESAYFVRKIAGIEDDFM